MKIVQKIINKIAEAKPIVIKQRVVASNLEFEGKTAIVFGGGTGIGLAIANELKNCGAQVVSVSRVNHENQEIRSEIMDVSQLENLQKNLDELVQKYPNVDIVVNSQGICPSVDFIQDFYGVDLNDFDMVIKVNLEAVYFINQYFCRFFERFKKNGNILNICSTEGLRGTVVPYGLSKAAVISLTKGLGKKMASKGIVINGIAPGATATEMMRMKCDGNVKLDYIPSKRATIPVEIAKMAHFLLSDAGRQMCGQVVVVDGGESLN